MVLITEYVPSGTLDSDSLATIAVAAPTAPASFVWPSAAELGTLMEMVFRAQPHLDLRADKDFRGLNVTREFNRAFIALAWMGRKADGSVDHKRSISFWCEHARDLLRLAGYDAQMPPQAVVAAAHAHGIAHARDALGLTVANTGVPATNAWRDVLKSGVRKASPEQTARGGYEPGQVRVTELAAPIGFMSTETR